MTPFSSSICQEVSCGYSSVFSSSSNLNSPTPQEQSGVIVGAEDGEMEGEVDGVEDGEMEGREDAEGLMDGAEEEVGIKETDGDVDGKADRLGSQSISIIDGSKYASHRA